MALSCKKCGGVIADIGGHIGVCVPKSNPTNNNKQDDLDDLLDELGFSSKPGSTKGRMYSSRFYHAELKQALQSLIDEAVKKARWDEIKQLQYELSNNKLVSVPSEWLKARLEELK